jgi:hypothetical protein
MTPNAPIAEIGLTQGVVLLIFLTWLGILAAMAFVAGVLAIAVVGPRRLSAVAVPGSATFVVVVALVLAGRVALGLLLLLAAMETALLVAVAQRVLLPHGGDIDRALATGPWFVIGGILAGIVTGAIIGAVAAAFIGPPSLLPLLAIVGAVFGALRGAAMGRWMASNGSGGSSD